VHLGVNLFGTVLDVIFSKQQSTSCSSLLLGDYASFMCMVACALLLGVLCCSAAPGFTSSQVLRISQSSPLLLQVCLLKLMLIRA
jgi:hypothetical protein